MKNTVIMINSESQNGCKVIDNFVEKDWNIVVGMKNPTFEDVDRNETNLIVTKIDSSNNDDAARLIEISHEEFGVIDLILNINNSDKIENIVELQKLDFNEYIRNPKEMKNEIVELLQSRKSYKINPYIETKQLELP
jgi:short-subunit dehydrogenase involved in D-alanine esterification of teichoic acids